MEQQWNHFKNLKNNSNKWKKIYVWLDEMIYYINLFVYFALLCSLKASCIQRHNNWRIKKISQFFKCTIGTCLTKVAIFSTGYALLLKTSKLHLEFCVKSTFRGERQYRHYRFYGHFYISGFWEIKIYFNF